MRVAVEAGGLRAAVITLLAFAVLGPPLGALTLSAVLPLFILVTSLSGNAAPVGERLQAVVGMAGPAVAGSYWAGLSAATATGLMVAVHRLARGFPGYVLVMLYASLAWAGHLFLGPSRDPLEAALLWPVHVVPALLCLAGLRRWRGG